MMKTNIKSSSFSASINEAESQMELGFSSGASPVRCHKPVLRRRQTVASLWFRRMRQIVDSATDFRPAPPARPLQPLLGRELSQERQLTE